MFNVAFAFVIQNYIIIVSFVTQQTVKYCKFKFTKIIGHSRFRDTHAPEIFRKTRVPHCARIFLRQIPRRYFFGKTAPRSPRKGYPGVPGKIMAQFFERRYPRRYFFSLPGAMLHGKGHPGYPEGLPGNNILPVWRIGIISPWYLDRDYACL